MVFFNADYQDVTTAQFNFDGLVVLAYFFEVIFFIFFISCYITNLIKLNNRF